MRRRIRRAESRGAGESVESIELRMRPSRWPERPAAVRSLHASDLGYASKAAGVYGVNSRQ